MLMKLLFTLSLLTFATCTLVAVETSEVLNTPTEAEPKTTKLFNGKDLTGWDGNMKLWSVQDGTITGKTSDEGETKLAHNSFLVWKGGTVKDFELSFKYRIEKGNSGVQYRSKVVKQGEQGPIVAGYQADFEAGKTYSGILYEEQGRGILATRGQKTVVKAGDDGKHKVEVTGEVGKPDEIQASIRNEAWNNYTIVARGNRLQHYINGKKTVDVTDQDSQRAPKEGVVALQIHTGPAMVVQFKDLVLQTE